MTVTFVVAIAVLLGLLLFLYNEVRRSPGPDKWGHVPRWPKRLRIVLAAIGLFIASAVFWGFLIEPGRLVIREETIQIDNWPQALDGLRIAVLSDIHVDNRFITDKKLRTIVERTNQRQPELILILGDYMTGHDRATARVEPEVIAPVLKDFRAPLGVYSVLGNHDWWYNGAKVRKALEQNGIKVLENESAKPVVESSKYGRVHGDVFANNHHLFVTTGIGTSIIPVRFGLPPEIVILTLKSGSQN